MNIIEERIIANLFADIINHGKFPTFGTPECRCCKCMFNTICPSSDNPNVAGCFHGWKKETER